MTGAASGRVGRIAVLIVGLAAGGERANADMLNFYAATPAGTVGRLAPVSSFGPITATAGQTPPGVAAALTVANFSYPLPNELGLGVCGSSDGGALCGRSRFATGLSSSLWSGDIAEIDNLGNNETLTLSIDSTARFTGRFLLSSLDDNASTNNFEDGYVSFGGNTVRFSRTASGATASSGGLISLADPLLYGNEVFMLTLTGFDPSITRVVFGAGGTAASGTNNDYLVAAAEFTPVPIPAAFWLLATALGGLGIGARRTGTGGQTAGEPC